MNNIRSGIRISRERSNMSLKELANLLKIDVITLQSWEMGAGNIPINILKNISKIFNVSIEFLLFAEEKPPITIGGLTDEQIKIVLYMYNTFKYKEWRKK